MDHIQILSDAARRPVESARAVLDGIGQETLHAMPGGRGNSVAWLIWHAARQQDAQLAHLKGSRQVWQDGGWATRLGVGRGDDEIGFGDGAAEVERLRIADPAELLAYLSDVVEAAVDYIAGLTPAQLSEVVDTSWDPPVTRGVRIISTIDDAVAHVAQAAYARGIVEGWRVGY
ncbi:DinB family protein [Tessaracoccus sp. OS52]|uniref:mycothiol transferase n=1 Tax=Tessaracoccus sp. OS52 TaxID=2886691 RepID=UPI001D1090DD|nr:DinB family protein [Tessaracoccus sp. OS52]MCC2594621.1 DinB family protein [Tessaracoccus sp. OS52]